MPNKSLKNKLTIVLVGRSGSGKGTQARLLLERLKKHSVAHLETGKFMRSFMKHQNLTAVIVRRAMAAGKILPSWLAAYTWLKELIEKGKADKHLVYDGAPRKVWEAELIDEVMRWHGRTPALCIYIEISKKEAMRRLLLRGRKDDRIHAIKSRLNFFESHVRNVIRYYKAAGRIIVVDGERPIEDIFTDINKKLRKRLGKFWPTQ